MRLVIRTGMILMILQLVAGAPIVDLSSFPDADEGEDEAVDFQGGGSPYGEDSGDGQYAYIGGGEQYAYDEVNEEQQQQQVHELFVKLDTDNDGKIHVDELRRGLTEQAASYSRNAMETAIPEAEEILSHADTNGDSRLSLEEFSQANELYMQHDNSLDRANLFKFADKQADGTEGDGSLDVNELAVLLFPQYSVRVDEFRSFLSSEAMRTHDEDRNSKMSQAELDTFHRAGSSSPHGASGDGSDDSGAAQPTWREQHGSAGRIRFGEALGGGEVDEEEDNYGGNPEVEGQERSATESVEWYDKDGDGLLDENELAEYMLPGHQMQQESYVDEELHRLLSVLRGGDPSLLMGETPLDGAPWSSDGFGDDDRAGGGGVDDADMATSFDIDQVLALSHEMAAVFQPLLPQVEDGEREL